jgi:hypothetical protein
MKIFALLFLAAAISGCGLSTEAVDTAVQKTVQAIPTQTKLPTLTPVSTYTPWPTYTAYPTYTTVPTATNTPTEAFTTTPEGPPTATLDPLYSEKGPGMYLSGVDIGPGVWRSTLPGFNTCYWKVADLQGNIYKNHFGQSGGTMYIPGPNYSVELGATCGIWNFLSMQ